MDIHLPGIQRFETTRRIMAQTPTPIVVVPGIDREETVVVEKPSATTHANALLRLLPGLGRDFQLPIVNRTELPESGRIYLAPGKNCHLVVQGTAENGALRLDGFYESIPLGGIVPRVIERIGVRAEAV
jgi:chemotaxis response regulator CheB